MKGYEDGLGNNNAENRVIFASRYQRGLPYWLGRRDKSGVACADALLLLRC